MIFKLSLSNIRRSLRDYAIYFFTLIIGVSVFYVFNAIGTQVTFLKLEDDTREIAELLKTLLSSVSVFVAGVLGLLIVYASRFLMKRRNKEFALYLMLGMGKGKISTILLLETVIIGIGSLGVGLVVGIGLSQLMSALVVNLFEADMTAYRFTVSSEAIVKTILYFAIMYLVVMIFNSMIISRFKILDLMQSDKKSEQIKLKNPILCVFIFIAAAAMLGYAYYKVGFDPSDIQKADEMLIYIAMGAVSTFLIFWSVSGMLLRVIMSMKNVYYRGLNSFTFRQISSKVNTMVFSMTVICLMLFVTICTLSASFYIRNSMNANLKELCSADFEIEYQGFADDEYQVPCYTDLSAIYSECGYDITEGFDDCIHFHTYRDPSFTFATYCGSHLEEVKKQFVFLDYDSTEEIIKLSDYNKLMKLYGKKPISLNDDEFILLCNFKSMQSVRDIALGRGTEITVFGNTLKSKYDNCQNGFISISAQHENVGVFVVPDGAVDESGAQIDYFIGNYDVQSKEEKYNSEKKVLDNLDKVMRAYATKDKRQIIMITTKLDISAASVGLGAIVTFLGLYIGLVFLIACGAILALKELSESVDSIGRYEMLRKIGADESDISKSLFRQTGIFFMLPLLLACVHSVFGMKFAIFLLEIFGTEKMAESIAATSIIILFIYGGYFLITYFCSKGIIKDKK